MTLFIKTSNLCQYTCSDFIHVVLFTYIPRFVVFSTQQRNKSNPCMRTKGMRESNAYITQNECSQTKAVGSSCNIYNAARTCGEYTLRTR